MQSTLRMEAVVDLDASTGTSATKFKVPAAGWVNAKQIFGRFEEAVASGGFSSAAGVASVEVGGVEVATITTGVAATARAIGDTLQATVDGTNVTNAQGAIKVAAGDLIECKTKTQGTGGTVTGTIRFYVPLDLNLA